VSPKRVAKPRTTDVAWDEVERFATSFAVLPTPADLFDQVRALVPTVKPKGAEVFDLAIAVTALSAGVRTIYTFDAGVFGRVPGMTVRAP
jgi:predicted nucleic acid-binding protein